MAGNKGVPPTRAYWAEKADYATMLHFPKLAELIERSGARVNVIAQCLVGAEYQKWAAMR